MKRMIIGVLAAGAALVGCSADGTDSETEEPPVAASDPADTETAEPRPVATEPVVGACIENMSVLETGDHAEHTPDAFVFVDCAGAHEAEIVGVFEIEGDQYPGADAIGQRMGELCVDAESSYLFDPDMVYGAAIYIPEQVHWEDGHRSMLCFVVPPGTDEVFEGPVGG